MANGALLPRKERWRRFDTDEKLDLALDDLDVGDTRFQALRDEIKSLKTTNMGVLIALTTASILLALNLGVGR